MEREEEFSKTEIESHEPIVESVETLKEVGKRAPKIEGVKTGIEGLDDLFFITKIVKGKPKIIPLGGIPKYCVLNLTGVSDTGKSLMAEQFTITQASLGNPTIFLTVETPATFLAASLKERAQAMNKDYAKLEKNIIIIDAASFRRLRENILNICDTLAYAIKKYEVKNVVIDSVTGLYEHREMMARQIVRRLFNFMKKWYQTAIFVSQKRSGHEELSAEAAGGYAVSHIVDASIVLAKQTILSRAQQNLYQVPIGEIIRLFRIDGCRMCGHDTKTRLMEITKGGLVKIGPSLSEILKERSAKFSKK